MQQVRRWADHIYSSRNKIKASTLWWALLIFSFFVVVLAVRLPYLSHGIDQADAVLYKDSLVDMKFHREAQWPLLLLIQKGLWLILPHQSPQIILSLTSAIFGAATLTLFFLIVYRVTKSYLASLGMSLLLFFIPLFGVYSVIGMQDMAQAFFVVAFLAAAIQFFYTQRISWLYATSVLAGLSLGIRMTLILIFPSLILVLALTKKLSYKTYLKIAITFVLGAFVGLIGDLFISPMPNSSASSFFFGLFHMFNPSVLGYWDKAGGYTLMSGYRHTMFYWMPMLWLVVYVLSKLRNKRPSLAPLISLGAAFISLAVAYGLSFALKKVGAGAPSHKLFLIQLVPFIALLIYESVKSGRDFWSRHYLKQLDSREKSILVVTLTTLCFIIFNYVVTAGSARYFLIVLAPSLILFVLLTNRLGWQSWLMALGLIIFLNWGCSFGQAQKYVATFKQLDPRSAVAIYARDHPGRYYDFEITDSTPGYFEAYGDLNRIYGPPTNWCASVDFSKTNYAIFYGPATADIVQSCPKASFNQIAKFQRAENIIEDSVGNVGFTIYRLSPAR